MLYNLMNGIRTNFQMHNEKKYANSLSEQSYMATGKLKNKSVNQRNTES